MPREISYIRPDFWSPSFFSSAGLQIMVGGDGRSLIKKDGSSLGVSLNETLDPGTEIEARYAGHEGFAFYIKAELDAENFERQEAFRRKREEQEQDAQRRREEAIQAAREFNETLNIPVYWVPNHKLVLSGLTERSSGTGTYSNTVYHVELREDLQEGRLRRQAGDLLCSPNRGSYDLSSYPEVDKGHQVTCKRCLELARRFQNNNEPKPNGPS